MPIRPPIRVSDQNHRLGFITQYVLDAFFFALFERTRILILSFRTYGVIKAFFKERFLKLSEIMASHPIGDVLDINLIAGRCRTGNQVNLGLSVRPLRPRPRLAR